MKKDYVIMDTTCGDLVGPVCETREEAEYWIRQQEMEFKYEIIERD